MTPSGARTDFEQLQNLIPLIFIRPLRLFISAEKLRQTRITLLKITHLPIVGIIWLFEKANEQLNGGGSTFSSMGPGSTQLTQDSISSSAKKQRPFLSNRTATKTSQHFVEVPNGDGSQSPQPQNYTIKGKKEAHATVAVNNTDLERQVRDLSIQISELTALIMAQQGTNGDE